MVQFGDKTWSSMLALCTHAAWDAYNYANRVESHKALFKPENPHSSFFFPPHSCSALWLWRKHTVFDGAAKAGSCGSRAFVIRDTPVKQTSWGNISKVGTRWNGSFFDRVVSVLSAVMCLCIHQHKSFCSLYINGITFQAPHVQLHSGTFLSCTFSRIKLDSPADGLIFNMFARQVVVDKKLAVQISLNIGPCFLMAVHQISHKI